MKVPAHKSWPAALARRVPVWAWNGNRVADRTAKGAAAEIPHRERLLEQFKKQRDKIMSLGKFTGLMLARVCKPTIRDATRVVTRKCRPSNGLVLVPEPNGHVILKWGKGYLCARCMDTGRTYSSLASYRCQGWPRVARCAHPSHKLWAGDPGAPLPIVWCSSCGAFARQRMHLLLGPCLGRPRNDAAAQSLAFLKEGRDPSARRHLFGRSTRLIGRQADV